MCLCASRGEQRRGACCEPTVLCFRPGLKTVCPYTSQYRTSGDKRLVYTVCILSCMYIHSEKNLRQKILQRSCNKVYGLGKLCFTVENSV